MLSGFHFTSYTVKNMSPDNKDALVCHISILKATGCRDNCFSQLRWLKLCILPFHIIRNRFDACRTKDSRVFWGWICVLTNTTKKWMWNWSMFDEHYWHMHRDETQFWDVRRMNDSLNEAKRKPTQPVHCTDCSARDFSSRHLTLVGLSQIWELFVPLETSLFRTGIGGCRVVVQQINCPPLNWVSLHV